MNNNKLSSINMLRILGCFVFDIALILAFFKIFGLFFIINPVKSVLILLVLFLGLMILNLIFIFSDMLFISIGIPCNVATRILVVLYAIIANVFSVLLIPESIVWYVVWQLIIFAVFILIFAIIAAFSNGEAKEIIKSENEQTEKAFLMLQLLEIDDAFAAKEDQEAFTQCINLFKALKERIQFSTPFGRIISNNAVLNAEKQINHNLVTLKVSIKENLDDKDLVKLQRLIKDTRRLVINREELNINRF